MAYVAVDLSGKERIFHNKPTIHKSVYFSFPDELRDETYYGEYRAHTTSADDGSIVLPAGTIKKLVGHEMSMYDEPIEL